MIARRLCIVLLVLPAVFGCRRGAALESLPEQQADAVCDTLETCYGEHADALFAGVDCRATLSEGARDTTVAVWQILIDRGSITYDASLGAQCVQELRNLRCDLPILPVPEACRTMFVGTVLEGDRCSIDEECDGDAYCGGAGCPATAGRCMQRLGNGAACTTNNECRTGLLCERGACGLPTGVSGGSCGGTTGVGCPADEYCLRGGGLTPGTCTPLNEVYVRQEGESCNETVGYCAPNLSCAVQTFVPSVAECVARVGSGEPCFQASPSMCPEGQFCDGIDIATGDSRGTCAPLPEEGDACPAALCARGLHCFRETCVALLELGESCAENAECYSLNCDGGECVEPLVCAP